MHRPPATAALVYAGFVVYGSLIPFAWRWRLLEDAWTAFLQAPYLDLGIASRADWVANILLYVPLAFLATGSLTARLRAAAAAAVALFLCAALAVAVEFAQLYFAPRTVSLNDLLAEVIGSAAGVALWRGYGERLLARWDAILGGGPQAGRALIASYAGAYLLFSLFPYDFLVSSAELAEKLGSPNAAALLVAPACGAALSCSAKLASEILVAAPLGAFLGMAALSPARASALRALGWGLLLGVVIEGLQTFLASGVSQGASILTRGAGMALGFAAYRSFGRQWLIEHRAGIRIAVLAALPLYFALLLALTGFFGAALESSSSALAKLREVRFLPFYYHYFTTETQAMRSLLVHAGAYAPIGVIVWLFGSFKPRGTLIRRSAVAAFGVALAMEALKLYLAGRHPDPTDALIAAAAAALACFVATRLEGFRARPAQGVARLMTPAPAPRFALAAALIATGTALAGWVIATQPREHYVDESRLPRLPAPQALAPVPLPHFRLAHPRLPSPTPEDLDTLRRDNPAFLEQVRSRARGGLGDLESAALQELAEPGSVDLDLVYRRLLELRFAWRGHEQVKPLAVAYDWLFERWSATQRAFLRGKLAEGCQYVIGYIRNERLSPYNVILYNSPLQALMACSITLYRDDPRGEAFMAFAADLWKNRVLPVWRQVMGRSGGWHEGAEYVGIGVGQAIYEVPAMWRRATGEDVMATEAGIRGFPDFLVYRVQPDGTQARLGDGAWFQRDVPDALALAVELGHRAAYSLARKANDPAPTSWPWGPLTSRALYDPTASAALPLAKHFDGIGLVVARSDWSADATYVTFKAGDNYWSHMHLDQGSFTIFKGGPLAIDSGLYGPKYGSDHHMNYSYQTVAHNTITVTDPLDTVPAPRRNEKPRPIANDGGQRRVGSGWGIEAAPLDIGEWRAKADTYRAGRVAELVDEDGLLVAAADLTAAYTNSMSGKGTFSHRTRRVERFWRVFVYDRVDDVIVVFDDVRATKPQFRKRWLLHSIDAPRIGSDRFTVAIPQEKRPGRRGGRLEGVVLWPKNAQINAIGGPGFEFFVDGKSYDEGGTVQAAALRRGESGPEPGAWRIEVTPRVDSLADRFLVVLLPALAGSSPPREVRRLEAAGERGAEVVGPKRTLRLRFDDAGTVRIDLSEGTAQVASHRLLLGSRAREETP